MTKGKNYSKNRPVEERKMEGSLALKISPCVGWIDNQGYVLKKKKITVDNKIQWVYS